ncbi:MAG: hypothetical protein MJ066_05785 [Clostridia bacterium]|nr:hypothetical protein [Clostridia bacterium]
MDKIERYIPIGKENAIHQRELAEIVGVNTNKLKKKIKEARLEGAMICSNGNGYFIAGNKEEARTFYHSMRKQAITRFNSIKLIKRKLREMDGQISLFDNVEGAKLE